VSGHLFRDGHYKQAALEAYIRVIEEVKSRLGTNILRWRVCFMRMLELATR
jgi:hypothetical protein